MKLTNKKYVIIIFFLISTIIATHYLKIRIQRQTCFNIILITIDALRPDHLGCYGYKLDTSPNIDKLAKESAVFTQVISQGTVTNLALPSLHTSTYPRTHGVYGHGCKVNSSIPSLAEILRKNDYTTAAIVAYNLRQVMPGLEQGFDVCMEFIDIKADRITQEAAAWLKKNHKNKFFLWLHYFDPHPPYGPPPPYNHMFIDNSKLGKKSLPISSLTFGCLKAIPAIVVENNITDPDYYISQYDGEIGFTDEQIGILFERIKELDLDEKTIIIITADHGELLGEHDIYFWHGTLYDETLKVPLIIKCNNIITKNKIITQQVQSIDIAPTILAMLNMPKARHMQGKSLLPLVFNNSNDNLSSYAFSEFPRIKIDDNTIQQECIRTEAWKLVWRKINNKEDFMLFDLNSDHGESKNLINTENKEFKILKKELDKWRRRFPVNKSITYLPVKEDIKALLKSLGYLQ